MLLIHLYLQASLVYHEEQLKESVNLISREFCVKALPYPPTVALQVEQGKTCDHGRQKQGQNSEFEARLHTHT